MRHFLLALQFLTIAPVRVGGFYPGLMGPALVYFPAAGLLIGLVLIILSSALTFAGLPQLTVGIAVVTASVIMSGGLHLDGVCDTADAFWSRTGRDRMLAIMRDPHAGALGVVSVVCVILLKLGLVYAVPPAQRFYPLVLMPVLSRWSLVGAMFVFPYARAQGRASHFTAGMTPGRFRMATLAALVCAAMIGQAAGVCLMVVTAASTYVMGRLIRARIGGMTGDTLGAVCELNEIVILASSLVLLRVL